jgi:DNA-binding MarR family transcriptional regulator
MSRIKATAGLREPQFGEICSTQMRGLRVANGHELAMRLRAAYLALHRRTNAALAKFRLTADQFVLLTALAEGDAIAQRELVQRTSSDPNTMSEMLARLELRGLIVRERHAMDARIRSVVLTPEGRRIQRALWRASDPLRVKMEQLFRPGALEIMIEQLDGIAGAMGAHVDEPARGRRASETPIESVGRTRRAALKLKQE